MLVAISAFLFMFIIFRKFYKKTNYSKYIPKVRGLPFIGIAHRLINPLDALNVFYEIFKEYGPNFECNVGPLNLVVIGEVNLLERILSSTVNLRKAEEYQMATGWLGEGLITSEGQHWKSHRKAITPTFHLKILEQFIGVFNKNSEVLLNKLRKEVGKDNFDVEKYTSLFAMDAICESAMGTSYKFQENPNHPYHQRILEIPSVYYKRIINPLYKINWIYKLSSLYKKEKEALEEIHSFCRRIIESRRKERKERFMKKDEFNRKGKVCFLDLLLQQATDRHPFSGKDILDEVNTFMFAGHDTTSVAISFVLYCLSNHSVIQESVYDEIVSIMGTDENILPTFNDLNDLKYLEMVIKETLRLYPSAPVFGRNLIVPVEYNNFTIPACTRVVIFPYLVHRDPSIYPEPEKFIPERFTTEENSKRHPYGYLAFSAGPRNCIGQKYAMLEIKVAVSKILRHYKVLPVPGFKPLLLPYITLYSSNGIRIRIEERL